MTTQVCRVEYKIVSVYDQPKGSASAHIERRLNGGPWEKLRKPSGRAFEWKGLRAAIVESMARAQVLEQIKFDRHAAKRFGFTVVEDDDGLRITGSG